MSTTLREALQRIYDERSQLTADDVVEEARNPESPLHGRFEWDDSVAGAKYRLEQAKRLIRSCKIVYRDDTHPVSRVRAFQHVTREDGKPTYMPSEEVVQDPVIREVLKRSMIREFRALKDRYRNFAEFQEMILAEAAELLDETG